MAKLKKFLATCPGCQDTHLGVTAVKPSFVVPTVTKVKCDVCESSVVVQVKLPRNRENRGQITYTPLRFQVSPKLVEMLEAKRVVEAAINEPPLVTSDVTPNLVEVVNE